MAGPSYPKLLFHLLSFSSTMKSSSSSSSSSNSIITSSKLKGIIHSFVLVQLRRFSRAISKAKTLIIEVVNNFHVTHDIMQISIKKNTKNKNKLYVGSFRLHYNWCSSRIMPEQVQVPETDSSNWNTWLSNNNVEKAGKEDDIQDSQLLGYLDWLEHKTGHVDEEEEDSSLDPSESEIDQLADLFIQNCHEKFRLEKIDSYRKFQEMMARSI